jgi:class 3 adenylate cyclase
MAYPAINAATMARLVDNEAVASRLAREVLESVKEEKTFWDCATRGEALFLLGRLEEARQAYRRAHGLAAGSFGDIASMRRQLKLFPAQQVATVLDQIKAPRVIAFSGRMIDDPQRAQPRFSADKETEVAARLRDVLASRMPAIGYSQPACGADILFLEAMQDLGCETQVIIPFALADFVRVSVSFAGGSWLKRFERALERATRVTYATEEPYLEDDILFEHASNLIQGMALLRAQELEADPMMLTVMEAGRSNAGAVGGTAANAAQWAASGAEVVNVPLDEAPGSAAREPHGIAPRDRSPARACPRVLKALLFADISGFARIAEQHTPRFAEVFLGAAKSALDEMQLKPADANTTGDGLYMVFDETLQAADFAVRLRDGIAAIDWESLGLASNTHVRIGLHTGPVFQTWDPIMCKTTYYGSHVNRAARLEPVVRPGQIFVTHAFAATLALSGSSPYRCEYIGVTQLAKAYGSIPLYRLNLRSLSGSSALASAPRP